MIDLSFLDQLFSRTTSRGERTISRDEWSSYLDHLPAIFHDEFMGRFLLAFERVLSRLPFSDPDDPLHNQPGLEEYVDHIHTLFDPGPADVGQGTPGWYLSWLLAIPWLSGQITPGPAGAYARLRAPDEFLPWLAGWVALSLREDWDSEAKRRLISEAVSLYRWRGTRRGLRRMLEIYTQGEVEIYEFEEPAHYFQVQMHLAHAGELRRKEEIARAVIEQEKPAHTFYTLQLLFPTMQIWDVPDEDHEGVIVGRNTLLGTTVVGRGDG